MSVKFGKDKNQERTTMKLKFTRLCITNSKKTYLVVIFKWTLTLVIWLRTMYCFDEAGCFSDEIPMGTLIPSPFPTRKSKDYTF